MIRKTTKNMCSLKDLLWFFRLYRSICHLNYLQVIKNVDRSVVCFLCSRFHSFSLSIIKRSWNMTQTKIEQFSRKTCFLKDLVSLSASNVRSVTIHYLQLIKNVNSFLVCFLCVLDFTHFLSSLSNARCETWHTNKSQTFSWEDRCFFERLSLIIGQQCSICHL